MMTNELYTQAASGNEQALWTLCKSYEPLFKSEAQLYRYKMADAYDTEDFISIGYITIWDIIRKGNFNPETGAFGAYLKQAIQWKFRNTFRDFAMKNMVCIGVDEDYYGTTTRAYVVHESVEKQRAAQREWTRKSREKKIKQIDAERAAQGLPPIYRPSRATEEEKAAHAAQVYENKRAAIRRYEKEHADEIREWKAAYYQRNKDLYRLNDAIRRSKISIESWTAKGNESKAQEARERLAKYEAQKAELRAS